MTQQWLGNWNVRQRYFTLIFNVPLLHLSLPWLQTFSVYKNVPEVVIERTSKPVYGP